MRTWSPSRKGPPFLIPLSKYSDARMGQPTRTEARSPSKREMVTTASNPSRDFQFASRAQEGWHMQTMPAANNKGRAVNQIRAGQSPAKNRCMRVSFIYFTELDAVSSDLPVLCPTGEEISRFLCFRSAIREFAGKNVLQRPMIAKGGRV